jgi:hypothetical protein
MCEDIFGCAHEFEIPISQNGEIVYWRCRCGKRQERPSEREVNNRKIRDR